MVEIDALSELTEDEAELYDRQIRLWGLDSQKRLVLSTHTL
jgi:molybdopterin/thiamine biosynthesis adenylyltransferase